MKTISELIRRAHKDIKDAGITDGGVVAAALPTVLAHYLATEPIEGARVPTERAMVPTLPAATESAPANPYERVAHAFEIPAEEIGAMFTIREDAVSLEVPVRQLPETKAQAAREITIVMAAVDHALDRETRTAAIRGILADYGRYDPGNFMTEIRRIPPEQVAIKGKPNSRDHQLIVRRPGMVEAARIIREWSGLPPEE